MKPVRPPVGRALPGRESGPSEGFTLIEVIAALVVFAIGVLSATALTTALSVRMQQASVHSEVVVEAQQHLDSLLAVPYAALVPGSTVAPIRVQGRAYSRTGEIVQVKARVRQVRVSLEPVDGSGPAYRLTSLVVQSW